MKIKIFDNFFSWKRDCDYDTITILVFKLHLSVASETCINYQLARFCRRDCIQLEREKNEAGLEFVGARNHAMEASTSKPARQKSFSRRVSFNEDTILPPKERRREYSASDIESRIPVNRRGCRICGPFCFWISVVLGLLLFLLLICGGLYYGFFKSHMPEVRLHRIDVATANLTVLLNATNGGEKTGLIYSRMIASVAASGVQFGAVRLADVRQPPRNSTLLEVAEGMEDAAHGKAEAHALVIDVNVRGRIDVILSGRKMHGFPFKIECRSINQSEIDAGRAPPCRFQLSMRYFLVYFFFY